jgi:peptidoglycan/LPS O-acetylase OafA/YrhL
VDCVAAALTTTRILAAAAADAASLLVFAAIGRHSHHEHDDVAGVLGTAWPFLVGAAVGWAASRGWRAPRAIVPTGLAVWAGTVCLGMLLRVLSRQGVAWSFLLVASIATAVFLLGWRLIAKLVPARSDAEPAQT